MASHRERERYAGGVRAVAGILFDVLYYLFLFFFFPFYVLIPFCVFFFSLSLSFADGVVGGKVLACRQPVIYVFV